MWLVLSCLAFYHVMEVPFQQLPLELVPGFLLLMLEVTVLPITVGPYNINRGNKASGCRVISMEEH